MSFAFRPAVRENVGLLIGLSGGTGSGKTFSAMRLAAGISGEKRFAVIDTESGRAKHYADYFKFDHGDLAAPFSPPAYVEAIDAADKAGYPVIVVDSMSHEWAGEGGILDWQEDELTRMAKDDYQRREACKMASWIKPKMGHKQMVYRMLQVRAHLILCFRAEEKIEMARENGKTVVRKKESLTALDGWFPICERNLPYELTASFLLTAHKPGYPNPIKLQQQHQALFPIDKPISEESGRLVREWSTGVPPITKERKSNGQEPLGVSESDVPSTPANGAQKSDPFKRMLGAFAEVKPLIGADKYYGYLGVYGMKHANEFRDLGVARRCFSEMQQELPGKE